MKDTWITERIIIIINLHDNPKVLPKNSLNLFKILSSSARCNRNENYSRETRPLDNLHRETTLSILPSIRILERIVIPKNWSRSVYWLE